LWNFSLVDPDNRRPVDYDLHANHLDSLSNIDKNERYKILLNNYKDGRIKLFILNKLLNIRKNMQIYFYMVILFQSK